MTSEWLLQAGFEPRLGGHGAGLKIETVKTTNARLWIFRLVPLFSSSLLQPKGPPYTRRAANLFPSRVLLLAIPPPPIFFFHLVFHSSPSAFRFAAFQRRGRHPNKPSRSATRSLLCLRRLSGPCPRPPTSPIDRSRRAGAVAPLRNSAISLPGLSAAPARLSEAVVIVVSQSHAVSRQNQAVSSFLAHRDRPGSSHPQGLHHWKCFSQTGLIVAE